jgi:hypothetical protein
MKRLAVLCGLACVLYAQQFKFNLEHLAGKAGEKVELDLNQSVLQFAAAAFSGKDADAAKVKKVLSGLEGIYLRHFEFKRDGEYSKADLDQIRNQLKAPEWQRIVGVTSSSDRENVEVWLRTENGKVSGAAVIAADPRSLMVANIVGAIDLATLMELGGQFGLPKLEPRKR